MKKNVVFHKNLPAPKSPQAEALHAVKQQKAAKRPITSSNNKDQSVKTKMKSHSKSKIIRG